MRSRLERGFNGRCVAILPVERQVVRCFGPEDRRVLAERATHRRGSREISEVQRHGVGGVLRLCRSLRDHDRERLPDVAHAIRRENRHRGAKHRLAAASRQQHERRNRPDPFACEIAAGEHGQHPRHAGGARDIHAPDLGVGRRRAHERRMRLAVHRQVVGEASTAGHERNVFGAKRVTHATEARAHGRRQIFLLQSSTVGRSIARAGNPAGQMLARVRRKGDRASPRRMDNSRAAMSSRRIDDIASNDRATPRT
jgi:hypothetical protein